MTAIFSGKRKKTRCLLDWWNCANARKKTDQMIHEEDGRENCLLSRRTTSWPMEEPGNATRRGTLVEFQRQNKARSSHKKKVGWGKANK